MVLSVVSSKNKENISVISDKSTDMLSFIYLEVEPFLTIKFYNQLTNKYDSSISIANFSNSNFFNSKNNINIDVNTNAVESNFKTIEQFTFMNKDGEIDKLTEKIESLQLELNQLRKYNRDESELNVNLLQSNLLQIKQENLELKANLDDLRNEIEFNKTIYESEVKKLKLDIEGYTDKLDELKIVKNENIKLLNKIKELSILSGNLKENNLKSEFNISSKVESLYEEKANLLDTINKLKSELKNERELSKKLEKNVKKLESDNLININLESTRKLSNIFPTSDIKPVGLYHKLNNEASDIFNHEFNCNDSFISEFDKIQQNDNNNLDINKDALISEQENLIKNLVEENKNLKECIENLNKEYNNLEASLEKEIALNGKTILEKEKLELEYCRLELELQKLEIRNEKDKITNEITTQNETSLSNDLSNLKKKLDIISDENVKLIKEISNLRQNTKKIGMVGTNKKKQISSKNIISTTNNNSTQVTINLNSGFNSSINEFFEKKEMNNSKESELEILKSSNKVLINKISVLELELERKNMICNKYDDLKCENEILDEKMKNMVNKKEMEYYKNLYLEIKNSINNEHESISSELIKLADSFNNLKDIFSSNSNYDNYNFHNG